MKNPKLQTFFRIETRVKSDNVIPHSQSLHVPQGTEEDMLRCLHVPERSSKDMLQFWERYKKAVKLPELPRMALRPLDCKTPLLLAKIDVFVWRYEKCFIPLPRRIIFNHAHPEIPKFVIDPGEMEQCSQLGFTHLKVGATEEIKML